MEFLSLLAHVGIVGLGISAFDDESRTMGRIDIAEREPKRVTVLFVLVEYIFEPEILASRIFFPTDLVNDLGERHDVRVDSQTQTLHPIFRWCCYRVNDQTVAQHLRII